MISRVIGKLGLMYARRMPNHRGRYRMFSLLDRAFGPFTLRTPTRLALEVYLSSAMDLSYFQAPSPGVATEGPDRVLPALLEQLIEGEAVVDVGANIGWLACHAGRVVGASGRVIALEPSPREYRRLLTAISANRSLSVVPMNCALADASGVMVMEIHDSHTGLNSLATPGASSEHVSQCPVSVFRGDEVLPALLGGRRVGLVKIDTEGAELRVIEGMAEFLRSAHARVVVVEITESFLQRFGDSKAKLYRRMNELGYKPTLCATAAQYDEVFVPAKASTLGTDSTHVDRDRPAGIPHHHR